MMEDTAKSIDKYLRVHGIKRKAVSDAVHMSEAKFSMMMTGRRRLQLDEYARICGFLGVDTNYFLKPIR